MHAPPKTLNLKDLSKSFLYAFNGIRIIVLSQRHGYIYLIATIVIGLTGLLLQISRLEWCWIIIAAVSVWTAEAINTAFEFLCDVASPEFHPLVEKAKDAAAGAVLLCTMGAAAIGLLILGPPLFKILKG
ncbi:MAG: hypothetical protein A3G91_05425 [Omnitrophica WOR_2 bacterium RIFCSPLOWO2_12_FULL_50_9]|nr:MAG: hypothetical protein A3D87_07935 [Omnitrophica WOR_2 bacterium RIFCSPHIGHO2_02_FULL_50_17]OGX42638.1 MAG: hypothetical protein A3G91_05425 [Omnitrophica WOR_2 bacterium RIFCSPLOWO2_12_FULL_50_9]